MQEDNSLEHSSDTELEIRQKPEVPDVDDIDDLDDYDHFVCESYKPTVEELKELARFWIEEDCDNTLYYLCHPDGHISALRRAEYAQERIMKVVGVIGDKRVDEIEEGVLDLWRARFGERMWSSLRPDPKSIEDRDDREWFNLQVNESRSGTRECPSYGVEELVKVLVQRLPDLSRRKLIRTIHEAIERIQDCKITPSRCDHEWEHERELHEVNHPEIRCWLERCTNCHGLRKREEYDHSTPKLQDINDPFQ